MIMDNDIFKQIVSETDFNYETISKIIDIHKLDEYLSKRYWNDEEQIDLKRYLSIEIISKILYSSTEYPDKSIFENISSDLLESVASFAITKFNNDNTTFFGKILANRIGYNNIFEIFEKYIVEKNLKSTQARILLNTAYRLSQELTIDLKLIDNVLNVMSNPKISVASLKILSDMILNYSEYVFSNYVIDCGNRCIALEITMYNYKQLIEIYKGMQSKIDWRKYAYYMISENNMKIIRQMLECGMDMDFDNDIVNIEFKPFDNKNKKLN